MTTPTNSPVRAASGGELTKFRANGQASALGLAIQHPATVYTARINQTFDTLDRVVELTYDGGSGTLANVKEGMTVYIGSTAGARDKGECRIRKTPSATVFYIGETSDIQFADNQYITIVDAFFFHPRRISNEGGYVMMDHDIDIGDLTRGGMLPRLGPVAAVIEQTTGTITFVPPNPSLSAAYDGATLASLLFAAPSASSTSNLTSATDASWAYPLTADQEYRWSCALTDSLGRVSTAYRRVFVNPASVDFVVNSVQGDFEAGGWSFEVTVYEDPGTIYDHALVALYVRDYHSGALSNIGKLAGYENVLACGWIDGESIEQDSETGWVTFTVQGPQFWMDKMQIDPLELSDTFNTPTSWNQIQEMTVDKALAHVLYWMTTAPLFMDLFLTGDTQRVRTLPVSGGSLLGQINALANKLFAKAACNSYGQMFVEVDQQIADSTVRSGITVVMDITSADYEPPLALEANKTDKTAMVQLKALEDADGVTDIFLHARAPGNTPNVFGNYSSYEDHIAADAGECRRIAGQLFAMENNPFEPLTLNLPSSNRLFDIAPRMVATITTDSGDNPRAIALTAQRLIPKRVEYSFEDDAPAVNVTFELEVTGVDGIDYFPPTAEDDNLDTGLEEFDADMNLDFPGIDDFFAETVPPEVTTPCNRDIGNAFTLTWSPRTLTGSTSTLIARALFPCKVRATGGSAGDTKIIISDIAFGDADDHKTCYAVFEGTRVLTGTWVGNVVTFSPVSDTEIDGFEIELDSGEGSVVSRYALGKFLETGNMGEPTTMCVAGQFYAIEPYTGYWDATFPGSIVGLRFYNFYITPGNSNYNSGVGLDGLGDFHLNYATSFVGEYAERSDGVETFNPSTQEFETSGNYGRIYFEATGNHTPAKSATLTLGSVYHDMKWALYEAQAIGRQLIIGNSTLYNVCAL